MVPVSTRYTCLLLLAVWGLVSSQSFDILAPYKTNCPGLKFIAEIAKCDPTSSSYNRTLGLFKEFNTTINDVINDVNGTANITDIPDSVYARFLNISELSKLIGPNPLTSANQCSKHQEQTEKVLRCSSVATRACIDPDKLVMLPAEDNLVAGLKYLCARSQEMDIECLKENMVGMSRCASNMLTKYIESGIGSGRNMSTENLTTAIVCSQIQFQQQCAAQILTLCGKTGDVVANYFSFMAPPVCGVTPPPVPSVPPTSSSEGPSRLSVFHFLVILAASVWAT